MKAEKMALDQANPTRAYSWGSPDSHSNNTIDPESKHLRLAVKELIDLINELF